MIITIDKKTFSEAVHIVSRFSERRSATLPALSGIAVVASKDEIKFRATNLETGIDFKVEGSVKSPGVVVLPALVLREVASSLAGSGSVTIEHAGETAVITSGSGKSTLKTLPAEDFPIIPIPKDPEVKCALPGAMLKSLIGAVVAAASTSTVRPELASVFLSAEGGVLKAVATDSFRLAEKKIPAPGKVKPFSVLIPAKNAADAIQTIPDGEVTLTLDEHQCAFSWAAGTLSTRLVSGTYPNYSEIIPKTFSAEAVVLKKDLESALRGVSIFSDTFQKIKLAFDPKAKRLSFSARNSDLGEAGEGVAGSVSGEALELSFNYRYLSAPLPLIATDSVTVSGSGIGRPLVIKGVGDASFLYLVMPMNQ